VIPPLRHHNSARAFFVFLPRQNPGSEGQARVVYDHLTLPIRRISRFRHGAEVLSKELAQVGIK
jgi:hypothetical protein